MDETAMLSAIGPPKFIHPLQVASNVAARLSSIRQRLCTEDYYLGKPHVQIPATRRWISFPCGQVLADTSNTFPEPITFVAVLHITSDAFSFSSSSLIGDSSHPTVLTGRATCPRHAVFHDDFLHVLAHLQELAVDAEDFLPDLAIQCSRLHLFHAAQGLSVPAYDMHDRLLRPTELHRHIVGADVVLRFHLVARERVVADVDNVTVVVPPSSTWPVTPRRKGTLPTNPYAVHSFPTHLP